MDSKKNCDTMTCVERCHTEEEYSDLLQQVQLLQGKLSSKVEVLLAVSEDLASTQTDRDKWKDESEFLQTRVIEAETTMEQRQQAYENTLRSAKVNQAELRQINEEVVREQRRAQAERDHVRESLRDAQGDMKVMRDRLATVQLHDSGDGDLLKSSGQSFDQEDDVFSGKSSTNGTQLRRNPQSLEQIEKLSQQYSQLEADLRSVLCEKEELIDEKQNYKAKCERLTQELTLIINNDNSKIITDVDGIIAENRFLKAQIQHAKEETGLARAALNRYRSLLERRKKPDGPGAALKAAKDQGSSVIRSDIVVVSPKQVRELLGGALAGVPDDQLNADGQSMTDYRSLSTALYEAVVDKNLALSHQRKANKILAARLSELEAKVRSFEEGQRSPIPRSSMQTSLVPGTDVRQELDIDCSAVLQSGVQFNKSSVCAAIQTDAIQSTAEFRRVAMQTEVVDSADKCTQGSILPQLLNVGVMSSTHYESSRYSTASVITQTHTVVANEEKEEKLGPDAGVQTQLDENNVAVVDTTETWSQTDGITEATDQAQLPQQSVSSYDSDDEDDFMSAVTSDLSHDQELIDDDGEEESNGSRSSTPTN